MGKNEWAKFKALLEENGHKCFDLEDDEKIKKRDELIDFIREFANYRDRIQGAEESNVPRVLLERLVSGEELYDDEVDLTEREIQIKSLKDPGEYSKYGICLGDEVIFEENLQFRRIVDFLLNKYRGGPVPEVFEIPVPQFDKSSNLQKLKFVKMSRIQFEFIAPQISGRYGEDDLFFEKDSQ